MRDIAIELRKYAGTRGGRAVLVIITGLALVLAAVGGLVVDGEPLALSRVLSYPLTMLEIGLPVVVVLLFTAEWSTRDAVQSFLLRPRRTVVLRSKSLAAAVIVGAGLTVGLISSVVALGVRALVTGTSITLAGTGGWDGALTRSIVTTLLYATFAAGIGLLVARTAIGLVIYLGAISLIETMLALTLGEHSVWLSLSQAIGRIASTEVQTADLPSLATALGLWIVAPLAIGSAAFLRREAR